jgi:hypothetical protein
MSSNGDQRDAGEPAMDSSAIADGRNELMLEGGEAPPDASASEDAVGADAADLADGDDALDAADEDVVAPQPRCDFDAGAPMAGWVATWGGNQVDRGESVFVNDDRVFVVGSFNGTTDLDPGEGSVVRTAASRDLALSAFQHDGTYVWSRTVGGPLLKDGIEPKGAALSSDGAIYVTTKFKGTINADPGRSDDMRTSDDYAVALLKFGSDDTYAWMRTWNVNVFLAEPRVALGPDGSVFVLGTFSGTVDFDPGPGVDERDWANGFFFLEKLDPQGTHQWVRTWQTGNPNSGGLSDLSVAADGSIWVIGFFNAPFLSKFDPGGVLVETKRWSGVNTFLRRIASGSLGSLYVTGRFSGANVAFDPRPGTDVRSSIGGYDVFVSKFDAAGDYEWTQAFGGDGWDDAGGLMVDECDAAWIVGSLESSADLDPGPGVATHAAGGFVSKLNADGSLGWARSWATNADPYPQPWSAIAVTPGGPAWIAGDFSQTVDFDVERSPSRRTSVGRYDAFLMRLDR